MNLLAVALAVTGAWFDADVAGSAKWPSGTDPVASRTIRTSTSFSPTLSHGVMSR